MRLDREAFVRGMWPEGFVAAIAVLAVAWPLTTLLRENTWIMPAVMMVALVSISGAIMRTLDLPPSLISIGQLLLGLMGISQLYLRPSLWRGVLPTQDTLALIGNLLRQAGTVLQTYAAPAPTTQGVLFLIVSVMTLTAVSVDSMGVTGRAPASAGIPLAAGFLVSVSNSGAAMEPWYFVAVAVPWLIMLAQQSQRVTRAWPSANRMESRGGADVSQAPRHQRGLAQVLGVSALVLAVGGAALLPHLPPTFLGEGLARNPDARTPGSDSATVAFTESMDPSQDLRNPSRTPVLTYRTDARALAPLRVSATEIFADGRWEATRRDADNLPTGNDGVLSSAAISDLSPEVQTTSSSFRAVGNALPAPHLAAPSPMVNLSLPAGVSYGFDARDDTVALRQSVQEYDVTYLDFPRNAPLPSGIGERPADPADFPDRLLEVDPVSAETVGELSGRVVGEASNSLEKAVLIQNHLRSGSYRYSLTLAPVAEADANDPIGGFLQTRQGYCVQFATAMVMMARYEGIPARMAVGFLPGSAQTDGTRQVVAADAHTWPELWIDGLGWTRFEPTPGIRSGQPPAYARSEAESGDEQTVTQPVPASTPTAEPTPDPQPDDRGLWEDMLALLRVLGQALVALLVLCLLLAVLPIVGRRHRHTGLRSATTPEEEIEGQWRLFTRSLQDLSISPPEARSPRAMARHYAGELVLDSASRSRLRRIAAALERVRYAGPGAVQEADAVQMAKDVRRLVELAREQSPMNIRVAARLIPRSGLEGVKDLVRRT